MTARGEAYHPSRLDVVEKEHHGPCRYCDSRRWIYLPHAVKTLVPCFACRRHRLRQMVGHLPRNLQLHLHHQLTEYLDRVKMQKA